jgi:hypothetical protein
MSVEKDILLCTRTRNTVKSPDKVLVVVVDPRPIVFNVVGDVSKSKSRWTNGTSTLNTPKNMTGLGVCDTTVSVR